MSMVIYPEPPPYILQDWVASIINHSTIFSEQKIFAIKNIIIYIIQMCIRDRLQTGITADCDVTSDARMDSMMPYLTPAIFEN